MPEWLETEAKGKSNATAVVYENQKAEQANNTLMRQTPTWSAS